MFDDLLTVGANLTQANHSACRIANKAAMLLQYAAATPDPVPMVDEALLLTLEMLQLTPLQTISTRFAQRCENPPDSVLDSGPTPTFGPQWKADACQQLRDIGFQEKWIMVLGDELDQWSPCLVPTSEVTASIEQLAAECAIDAAATTETLLARDPAGAAGMPNLRQFSNAVCGLAIVLATLSEPDYLGATEEVEGGRCLISSIALTHFGAHLIVTRHPYAH